MLTEESFTARLAPANLASKSNVANIVKKLDLSRNKRNKLSKKVKAISTKGLMKYLINKFIILNGARYFSSGIFQNCTVFIPAKNTLNILVHYSD